PANRRAPRSRAAGTPCKRSGTNTPARPPATRSLRRMTMRSTKPMVLVRLLLPGVAMLGLQACAGAPRIVAAPSACSTLLPADWLEGVPGAPLTLGDSVGEWIAFGDAHTGQLDKANDRHRAGVGIIQRCEDRDREAVKRARPKVLGVF